MKYKVQKEMNNKWKTLKTFELKDCYECWQYRSSSEKENPDKRIRIILKHPRNKQVKKTG
jgi:hypothetical protein